MKIELELTPSQYAHTREALKAEIDSANEQLTELSQGHAPNDQPSREMQDLWKYRASSTPDRGRNAAA